MNDESPGRDISPALWATWKWGIPACAGRGDRSRGRGSPVGQFASKVVVRTFASAATSTQPCGA